jgi:hypothetical protein
LFTLPHNDKVDTTAEEQHATVWMIRLGEKGRDKNYPKFGMSLETPSV